MIDVLFWTFKATDFGSKSRNRNFIVEYGLYEVGTLVKDKVTLYDEPKSLAVKNLPEDQPVVIYVELSDLNTQ